MSELEFRAWDIDEREWLDSDHYIGLDGSLVCAGFTGHYTKKEGSYVPMQYTGQRDPNGVKIFEGDILNICFTSGSGEYIHDGVYTVSESALGALEFDYRCLFWESHSYNQHPTSSTLCEQYGSLSTVYDKGRHLIAPDKYVSDIAKDRDFPFNNEKVLSFNSRYFKVIGNIYENPELLATEGLS
jgi:uncharacterized phage protein (TIGR01671 family)